MQHFAFVLNKCACFSPQNQFIFYPWGILNVFSILASLYDCKLCSLIHNINENTDETQKKKNQNFHLTVNCGNFFNLFLQLLLTTSINTCSLTCSWIYTMIMVKSCLKAYSLFFLSTQCVTLVEKTERMWMLFVSEKSIMAATPLLVSFLSS